MNNDYIKVDWKPVVYIAGPFSSDPENNTIRACKVWEELYHSDEVVPICPHWSAVQEQVSDLQWEDYLTYDLELIHMTCHAILRISGHSPGADLEERFAKQEGLPIFRYPEDLKALYAWAEDKREALSNL